MRDKITIFRSYEEAAKKIPKEYRADFYEALFDYALDDVEPEFDEWGLWAAFEGIRPNIDSTKDIHDSRSEAGRKSGETRRNKNEQSGTNANKTEQTLTNANEEEIEIEEEVEKEVEVEREREKGKGSAEGKGKSSRFSPPTVEEVADYCQERGNNVDANRFIDFYASKGWKVGSQPMKDWKAAVRTWENRDNGYSKIDRPPNKKTGGIYAASMKDYGWVDEYGVVHEA